MVWPSTLSECPRCVLSRLQLLPPKPGRCSIIYNGGHHFHRLPSIVTPDNIPLGHLQQHKGPLWDLSVGSVWTRSWFGSGLSTIPCVLPATLALKQYLVYSSDLRMTRSVEEHKECGYDAGRCRASRDGEPCRVPTRIANRAQGRVHDAYLTQMLAKGSRQTPYPAPAGEGLPPQPLHILFCDRAVCTAIRPQGSMGLLMMTVPVLTS